MMLLLTVASGGGVARSSSLTLVLTGAITTVAVLLALRKRAILIVLPTYFIISYLTGQGLAGGDIHGILPGSLGFITDIFLLGYLALTVGERLLTHQCIVGWRPLDISLSALGLVAILSIFVNQIDEPRIAILGVRASFEYIAAFYLILNLELDDVMLRRTATLLMGIAWLQLPMGILYYFLVANPARDRDMVVGTMSGILASYVLIVAGSVALASLFLSPTQKLPKLLMISSSPIFAALSSAMLAFVYHLLAFFLVCLLFVRRMPLRVLVFTVSIIALFTIILSFYPIPGDAYLLDRSDLLGVQGYVAGLGEAFDRQTTSYGQDRVGGRSVLISFAFGWIAEQGGVEQLFGIGPGATMEGGRLGTQGRFLAANPDVRLAYLDWTRIYTETGPLSLAVSIATLLMVASVGFRVLCSDRDPFWRALGVGGAVAGLMFVLYFPYATIWAIGQPAVFFWSLAGLLVARTRSCDLHVICRV